MKRTSSVAAFLSLCAVLLLFHACVKSSSEHIGPASSSTSGAGGGSFDKTALLASLGEDVVLAECREFVTVAETLRDRTADYAASGETADRDEARQAWRDAIAVWQRLEVMQFGPAAVMGTAGGQDLRDEIYSWPLVNRCRTDQETVEENYLDVSAFAAEAVNVRGLDAIEYLLFNDSSSNACPPQNAINQSGSWNAVADVQQNRADYASTLAQIVLGHASQLRDAWEPGGGNFVAELSAPGGTYSTTQAALNAVSDALFYVETQTKDMKLGVPSGLSACDAATCPDELESLFAHASKEHVRNNLLGFRALFLGQDIGFDDCLSAIGAADLSLAMASDLEDAIAAVDAIEEATFALALQDDPDSVEDLYFAVKRVTDNVKTQFISVLDLELPQSVEGDND